MSRGKRKRAVSAAAAGTFILLLPLMGAAAASAAPSAKTAAFAAARASAALSMTDVFTPYGTENYGDAPPRKAAATDPLSADTLSGEAVSTEILSADKPEKGIPKETQNPLFEFDDSEMLSWGELLIPNSTDEERYVPEESEDPGPKPYPESLENHDGVITSMTYGHMNGENYIDLDMAGQVRNVTDIPNEDIRKESRLLPEFTIEKNGEPQVLIMHTHATESYEPYERDFYDASFSSRTTDKSMNMSAVGDAITKELKAAGIGVIHDTTLHDYPSYNGSYDLSRETVQKYLDEYPSIKIVLDVHRDAIERESGERIAPAAEINGRNAAQVMIISGCDDGTMNMPNCMKNLRFACLLQGQLESDWQGLTRPVLFDYRKYNQDLTTGSILIEVGGHANSIDQAVYSGELIGKSLVKCLSELT